MTPALVQGHVHQDLVERAVHERGVERDHRMQPAVAPGRRRSVDGVLLGDPDVEHAVGIALRRSRARPVGRSIAAVIATMSGTFSSAISTISSANTSVQDGRLAGAIGSPVSGSILLDGVELVGRCPRPRGRSRAPSR